jgi:hypothetical protein
MNSISLSQQQQQRGRPPSSRMIDEVHELRAKLEMSALLGQELLERHS